MESDPGAENSEPTKPDLSDGSRVREEVVRDRMREVLDPCSCMTDSPVDIVALGLVQNIRLEDECAHITLVPTTPMCVYMTQIIEDVKNSIGELNSIKEVIVDQDLQTMWTHERMSSDLQDKWNVASTSPDRAEVVSSVER